MSFITEFAMDFPSFRVDLKSDKYWFNASGLFLLRQDRICDLS